MWFPPRPKSPIKSPNSSPHTPSGSSIIPPSSAPLTAEEERQLAKSKAFATALKSILLRLPADLTQELVTATTARLESEAMKDNDDQKIILALLQIERTKVSDFFFGVPALFEVLTEVPTVKVINISKK